MLKKRKSQFCLKNHQNLTFSSLVVIILTIFHLSHGNFTKFSLNLYKVIAKANAEENCVISPSSIAVATGLVLLGASGETRSELERALGDVKFENLIQKICNDSSIESANRIFVSNNFKVLKSYEEGSVKNFMTTPQQVHFNDNRTVDIVNNWVEKTTHGYIKKLVESFEPDLTAVVINAMYFKATWRSPFAVPGIKINFHHSTSRKSRVPVMIVKDYFKFANLENLQILELPYNDTDIRMVILLPKEIDGLKDLEEGLNAEELNLMMTKMSVNETTVSMPRFKVEFNEQLNEAFKKVRRFY